MSRFARKGSFILLIALCVFALTLMSMGLTGGSVSASTKATTTTMPIGLHGYDVSLFAQGTKKYYNPDDIEVVGKYVVVAYQNGSLPDGSNHLPSTIVAYTLSGKFIHSISVNGHCDGLRYDPYTKQLWATSNEDANPILTAINLSTWATAQFSLSALHGGGYDDMAFQNGMAFFAASNPSLNSAGINTHPALVKVAIINGKPVVTPVLYGNATATDLATGQKVTLNLTDPDSISIDPQGDIVLDSQGDAELVFLHNAGTAQQAVSRLSLGTQVNDSLWIPASYGRMVITDGKLNAIYAVTKDGGFTPGTVYSAAPSDSGVAGFVGMTDTKTGTITPTIIGLSSPKGLGFIPA